MIEVSQPSLTLYVDYQSQPARSIICLCKLAKIPFRVQIVDIRKLEQRSKEFGEINPNKKVPAMTDILNGRQIAMFEATAIMRYICNRYLPPDNQFYPRNDPVKMGKIEEMITFHHKKVRPGSRAMYAIMMAPMMGLADMFDEVQERADATRLAEGVEEMFKLGKIDFEKSKVTIADLIILPEVSQYVYGGVELEHFPLITQKLEGFFAVEEIAEIHKDFWETVRDFEMRVPDEWKKFIPAEEE